MFDILANCPELREQIIKGIEGLKAVYPHSWFKRFVRNLESHFSNMTSDGVLLILSQRPANAFLHLQDEQFKHYVLGTFQEFIEEMSFL